MEIKVAKVTRIIASEVQFEARKYAYEDSNEAKALGMKQAGYITARKSDGTLVAEVSVCGNEVKMAYSGTAIANGWSTVSVHHLAKFLEQVARYVPTQTDTEWAAPKPQEDE